MLVKNCRDRLIPWPETSLIRKLPFSSHPPPASPQRPAFPRFLFTPWARGPCAPNTVGDRTDQNPVLLSLPNPAPPSSPGTHPWPLRITGLPLTITRGGASPSPREAVTRSEGPGTGGRVSSAVRMSVPAYKVQTMTQKHPTVQHLFINVKYMPH